jgi:hypothetical protein
MQADCTNGDRPAIAIVGGISDELIVEHDLPSVDRKLIIGLDYLLQSGVRELTVTNKNAQSSLIEEFGMDRSNRVHDACKSNCVVWPSPALAGKR